MSYITIGDLVLILDDLFGPKKALLDRTLAFQIYGPALEAHRDKLIGLRRALDKKPLAGELYAADELFDTTVRAIHYLARGLCRLPLLDGEKRAFLKKVGETFVPNLGITTSSYEDEAAAAKKRRDDLEAMRSGLEAFPVAPGLTLYTLVAAFIDAGLKIDALLAARAEITAEEEADRNRETAALRPRTIGTLGQFRQTLAQEILVNPALPEDLEAKVFSYYDQIAATREDRYPKPPAAPETPAD